MSSPPPAVPAPSAQGVSNDIQNTNMAVDTNQRSGDADADEEMEDSSDPTAATTRAGKEAASTSVDAQSGNANAVGNTATGGPAHVNRKDATLREFLSKMDDYAPIIPDAVTAHYLTVAGLPPPSPYDPTGASTNTTPLPLARILALATQKFIADIAADAYQYSRIRSSNTGSGANPLGAGGIPASNLAAAASGAGASGSKGQQITQLGVQRSGYGGGGQGGGGQGRAVLTMEDLGMALQEYGVNVKRGEFYR